MSLDLEPWQIQELARCVKSAEYFVETFCWLQQKASAGVAEKTSTIPFEMGTVSPSAAQITARDVPDEGQHYFQREILRWLQNRENVTTKKSRRVGCSWIAAAYVAWLINFFPDTNVVLISETGEKAKGILAKVEFILKNLAYHDHPSINKATKAPWLRGEIVICNTEQIAIGWRDDEGLVVSESIVKSVTNTDRSAASDDCTFIVFDELAFYEHPNETWAAALPTLTHNGHWMAISTVGGMGDVFHRLCSAGDLAEKGQLKGELGFKYRKIHWCEAGLTVERIAQLSVGNTDEKIRQEWEMEFVPPGTVVFHPTHLAMCYKPLDEYPEVYDELVRYRQLVNESLMQRAGNTMYYSGADTAVGKAHKKSTEKDFQCFIALTRSAIQAFCYYSQEELSKWAGVTLDDPSSGGKVELLGTVSKLHQEWPGILYVEEEGPGYTTVNRHQMPDDGFSQMVPVSTKAKMKKGLIERLVIAVESHQIIITDLFTYQCMQVYQQTAPGVYEAPPGFFDDPVMALAIAYDALFRYGAIEFSWGATTDGLKRIPDSEKLSFSSPTLINLSVLDANRRYVDDLAESFTVPFMDDYSTLTGLVDGDMFEKLKREL